ncbi:MAG: UPF0758 domain-containing protein, partial [Anaerolineae bacterium]|nr:UPF0758 domain-containing protein [Anaerolineae bacterium]
MPATDGQTYAPRRRLLIRDLPPGDRPRQRLAAAGPEALSASELLAILLNTPDALALAQEMLAQAGDLQTLSRLPIPELRHWRGIGPVRALRLQAAFALGRRLLETPADDL